MWWIIILVIIVLSVIAANSGKNEVKTHEQKVSEVINSMYDSDYGEDIAFVEEIYNVDIDDPDYYDIDEIRAEDDDNMLDLSTKFVLEEIVLDEDIQEWYEEIKELREHKVKYLKMRIKDMVKKEGFNFK